MKRTLLLFFSLITYSNFVAQDKLDKAIEILEKNYTQEKVYILFDKEQYVAGDKIYFKSFIFNGYSLSNISNTLYVELYDKNKNLIDKRNVLLQSGKGNGDFELKQTTEEDVYYIRAFTNLMTNFEDEWNYIKPIPVYNPASGKKLALPDQKKWTAAAFPEGGTMIDGIQKKVAVRLYSNDESPKNWGGYLIDQELPDRQLINFQALDNNVGHFSFIPKLGKSYKVIVKDDIGNSQTIDLPSVADNGIDLKVTAEENRIRYIVKTLNLSNNSKDFTVVGIIGNQLFYKAKLTSGKPEVSSIIPTNIIDHNAILQLYLFDENENLVSQRLAFLKSPKFELLHPIISNKNLNNIQRSKNSFDIQEDSKFNDYTVLIRDISEDNPYEENILSAIWLTQDFKSPINASARYFSEAGNLEALDALLLSEKWKRFDWKQVLAGQVPKIKYNLKDNQYISYKAKLALNSRPLPNTSVNLVIKTPNGKSSFSQFETDNNGELQLYNLNFDETNEISFFLNNDSKVQNNLTFVLKPIIDRQTYKPIFPETQYILQEKNDKYKLPIEINKAVTNLKNRENLTKDEMLIEAVKLTKNIESKKAQLNAELTRQFTTRNATIFDFVNDNPDAQNAQDIIQWLQGRVLGLVFKLDEEGNMKLYIRDKKAPVYLDEVRIDASLVSSIPVSTIAMVKIIKNNGLVGSMLGIYLRNGKMIQPSNKESNINNKIEIKAYDKASPYQLIDYSKDVYSSIVSDTRQVLYWNANLLATSPQVSFYNNDEAKNRQIIIISFDKNDKLLYYNEIVK